MRMLSIRFAFLLLLLRLAVPVAAEEFRITIYNRIVGSPDLAQPLTPAVLVVHGPDFALFAEGGYATPGLEAFGEDGRPSDLVAEISMDPNVRQVIVGGGTFYEASSIDFSGRPGDRLSWISMLGRSNDLFAAVCGVDLPEGGLIEFDVPIVWDAGTEENTGLVRDIPFYGHHATGPEEHRPIAPIGGYRVVDDPDAGEINYAFPPAIRVVLRSLTASPAEPVSWGRLRWLWSGR